MAITENRRLRWIGIACCVASVQLAWGDGVSVSRVQLIAATCVTCHGPDGQGSKQMPELRDLEYQDIIESFAGFKSGAEKSTMMNRLAKAYTDEEIKELAKYFGQ